MKPGYYIDWADDIMIIYPNGTYDFFNQRLKKFERYSCRECELNPSSDYFFLADL